MPKLRWLAVFFVCGFSLVSSALEANASDVLRYNFRWDKQQYTVLVGTRASLTLISQTQVRIDVKGTNGKALTGSVIGLPGSSTRPLKDAPPVAAMLHIKGFPVPVIRIVLWVCGAANCSALHYYYMPHFFLHSAECSGCRSGDPDRMNLALTATLMPDSRAEMWRRTRDVQPVSSTSIFAVDRTTEGYLKTDYYFSYDKTCGGHVTVFEVEHGTPLPAEMVVGTAVPSNPFNGYFSLPYRPRSPSDEASVNRYEAAFAREGC